MRVLSTIVLSFLILIPCVQADPYVFPILPGTPEWNELTLEERREACQIPDSILASMTTEDLYLTYLTIPLWIELGLYSTIQYSFDLFRDRYNCVSNLMERSDVVNILFSHYIATVIDETNYDDFDQSLRLNLTEIILLQYELIETMTPEQKHALVEKTYSIYRFKDSMPSASYLRNYGLCMIGRIMYSDNYEPLMELILQNEYFLESLNNGTADEYKSQLLEMSEDYTGISTYAEDETPTPFSLSAPYPNPFNPETTITYTLPEPAPVTLTVYNATGQQVATLVDDPMTADTHTAMFDGSDLSSGVYFARITAGGRVATQKMLLVK